MTSRSAKCTKIATPSFDRARDYHSQSERVRLGDRRKPPKATSHVPHKLPASGPQAVLGLASAIPVRRDLFRHH
jgi:hypothetical protein